MSKSDLKRQLYIVSALTLIAVLIWSAIEIYQIWQKVPEPVVPLSYLKPLVPKLNKEVIDNLRMRKQFNEEELSNFKVMRVLEEETGEEESTAAGLIVAPIEATTAAEVTTD